MPQDDRLNREAVVGAVTGLSVITKGRRDSGQRDLVDSGVGLFKRQSGERFIGGDRFPTAVF